MARFKGDGRDTAPNYQAAATFRDRCLRADGSFLFPDTPVWTAANLDRLREKFVDSPDTSDRSFREKFADQLKGEPQAVVRLAAELLAVYFLFPSNVSAWRKGEVVGEVLGWGGDTLEPNHAVHRAFAGGIGSGGQGYNTRRHDELAFLLRLATAWKKLNQPEADQTAADPWLFQEFVDGVEDSESRQLRHMLLHLLFPDHFERIASRQHKWAVEAAFSPLLISAPEGVIDRRLLAIRQTLEQLLPGQTLDFYWPPLAEAWYDSGSDGDLIDVIHHKRQAVMYGPPGTSKTHRALRVAERIIRSAALRRWGGAKYFQQQALVREAVDANVHVVQLHPAFSYEDFVRGLHLSGSKTEYRPGVLLQVLAAMNKEPAGERLPHVLVLDEMNRTDLSRMLGECFSLLENRDRPVRLSGTTADGGELTLSLPSDLYVVGTMNLIDQSVEQIDFALRRRFLWIECPFDPDVLLQVVQEMWAKNSPPKHGWERVEDDFRKLTAAATALNRAVRGSDLLGPQYEVGHTYFFDAVHFLQQELTAAGKARRQFLWNSKGRPLAAVERLWELSLKPLLEEYLAALRGREREEELTRLRTVFFSPSEGEG